MRKLYRYNEVPLIEIGLTKEYRDMAIRDTIANTINLLIAESYNNLTDIEITALFYKSNTCNKIRDFSSGWFTKPVKELVILFKAEVQNNTGVLNLYGNDEYLFRYKGRWFRA